MAQQDVFYDLEDISDVRGTVWADATNVGGVTFIPGKVGNCADFSGSSQRLDFSSSFYHNLSEFSFHMVGWVRLDALGQNHGLFGQSTSSYHCHVIGTNKVRFRVLAGASNVILDSTGTLSVDTWHHVSVGYDHDAEQIFLQIDQGTVQTLTTSGNVIAPLTSNFQLGSIGTGNYMNGKIDEFMMRREGLYTTEELEAHYASGAGAAFQTELQLDYAPDGGAWVQKLQAKPAQIGGSGTQACYHLVITGNELAPELHDSDETATVEASGAGSLRFSTDLAGANPIAVKIKSFVPGSGGGDVEVWVNNLDELDGTSGTDFYAHWHPSGHTKSQPPVTNRYGARAVLVSTIADAWLDDDFTGIKGNNGTATGTTISTDAPFGVGSWQFDGVDDRVVVPDAAALDLTGDIFLEMWFNCTGDNTPSSFQGLVSKRLGNTTNYNLAFESDVDMLWQFFNGSYRTTQADFVTNYGTGVWNRVVATMTGSTVTELFNGTTSLDSDSHGVAHPANTATLKFGNIEFSSGVFNQFPFYGKMKGIFLHNSIPSADIQTTLHNNQNDPDAFWDHSFVAYEYVSATSVSGAITQGGQELAGVVGVDVSLSGSITQGGQTLAGATTLEVSISGSITQGGQTLAGAATLELSVSGSITQSGQVLAGVATLEVSISGSITQGGQVLAGIVGEPATATHATGTTSVYSRATGTTSVYSMATGTTQINP